MQKIIKQLVKLVTGTEPTHHTTRKRLTHRDLIRMESKIGAALFGPVPKGHRREFFCLDDHTWIWYEEWIDQNGKRQSVTTRYEIHPTGILKVQDGQPYEVVVGTELHNFALATRMYRQQVLPQVYGRDAITGQRLQNNAA
jgi:hypothetical protein